MPVSRAGPSTRNTRSTRSTVAAASLAPAPTQIITEDEEEQQQQQRHTSRAATTQSPPQISRSERGKQASRGRRQAPSTSTLTTAKQLSQTLSEVIEISSDEDELPLGAQQLVGDLRKQVKKLRNEVLKLKQDSKQKDQKILKLQEVIDLVPPKDGIYIDTGDIDDAISCEVCAATMWKPYTLTDCGHTFCHQCLTDWFETCLKQFRGTHPNQQIDPRNQILAALNPATLPLHVQQFLEGYTSAAPQYTCPVCRTRCRRSPTENFALKGVIQAVMKAHEKDFSPTGRVKAPGLKSLGVTPANAGGFSKYFPC